MDPNNQKRSSGYGKSGGDRSYGRSPGYGHGSYGYGYGSYGYGSTYGYGAAEGGTTVQRTIQDYLLILRERIWYLLTAFAVVMVATAIFTFTRVPEFQSTATVEIFHRAPTVMQVQQVSDSEVNSAEDLNTQVNILQSQAIVQGVADKLVGADLERFLAPYQKTSRRPSLVSILRKNREVVPERLSYVIGVSYDHPDRDIAARVANLFVDAYIAYNARVRVDESMKAVEELQERANEQRKKVDEIAASIQAYREKNKLVSLDQRTDIDAETLKELNTLVTQTSAVLQNAEIRLDQVKDAEKTGRSLLELSFIASVPAVSQLQTEVAAQKIVVAQLGERYRDGYPKMIAARRDLQQAEDELNQAIKTSAAQVEADYQSALQNYTKAEAARTAQEKQSLNIDRFGLEYNNLQRDFEVNEKILEQILDLERVRQTASTESIENQNARIIDRATPALLPYYPRYTLNLGIGGLAGCFLGIALAFFAAHVDDRIKSAFDIEVVAGLNLIGIIPEIRQMGDPDEMQKSVQSDLNRESTEAFTTLFSSLQLKEESKKAQCMLITSTIAGEGKSFITTNLAKTYAAHGERILVLDCDLRRPAVNRVFHLENLKGVIDVCSGEATLDDVINKNVVPNLDVITTGGRSKSPAEMLNGKPFALMLSDLRKRYDRIFVDTPPIAIVGDGMLILPLVDGSIYAIYFNKARRKAVQYSAQRLLNANVPNFGAILNGLSGGIGGYYYSHYYDRSYKNYYVTRAESLNGSGSKIASAPSPGSHRKSPGSK